MGFRRITGSMMNYLGLDKNSARKARTLIRNIGKLEELDSRVENAANTLNPKTDGRNGINNLMQRRSRKVEEIIDIIKEIASNEFFKFRERNTRC